MEKQWTFEELLQTGYGFWIEFDTLEEWNECARRYHEFHKLHLGTRDLPDSVAVGSDLHFYRGQYGGWNIHGDTRHYYEICYRGEPLWQWSMFSEEAASIITENTINTFEQLM